jgi:1,4-dihydroxy-2-naphthoate octaprenyltransferase
VGALLIQIGCNFANDAFDSLKGADTAERIGPQRAVASGLISSRAMLMATALVLVLAFLIGLYLSSLAGWPIFILGVVSLLCAVAYTAGPFPLAYVGLGDLFVLLFFGWAAVLGSAYVQAGQHIATHLIPFHFQYTGHWGPLHFLTNISTLDAVTLVAGLPLWWWWAASAVGLQATGIIAVNNLRDIPTDTLAGKRTLAVRLGDPLTRVYIGMIHVLASVAFSLTALHGGGGWLWLAPSIAGIGGLALMSGLVRTRGAALNGYLARSAALELISGLCLTAGLIISARHAL